MPKYEYETVGFTPFSGKNLGEWLNEYGAQGWQLVGFERIAATHAYSEINYRAVWMRPLTE